MYIYVCKQEIMNMSKLMIVSSETKNKQAMRDH